MYSSRSAGITSLLPGSDAINRRHGHVRPHNRHTLCALKPRHTSSSVTPYSVPPRVATVARSGRTSVPPETRSSDFMDSTSYGRASLKAIICLCDVILLGFLIDLDSNHQSTQK